MFVPASDVFIYGEAIPIVLSQGMTTENNFLAAFAQASNTTLILAMGHAPTLSSLPLHKFVPCVLVWYLCRPSYLEDPPYASVDQLVSPLYPNHRPDLSSGDQIDERSI